MQRARADQERARNEAEAYRNDILPRARGEADRITQEAEAYKTQVIDLAQGEVSSILAFYNAYKKAPELTGRRLYLDSVDELLKKSPKVIIDAGPKGSPGLTPILSLPSLSETKPAPPQGNVVQGPQR